MKHNGKRDKKIMNKIGGEFHNLKSNTTNMVQKLKAHIRKNFEM